jgi:hypothetical protein
LKQSSSASIAVSGNVKQELRELRDKINRIPDAIDDQVS